MIAKKRLESPAGRLVMLISSPDPVRLNWLSQTGQFASYDLVVYFSTDTAGDSYGQITVTDSMGATTASTMGTKQLWGTSPNLDSTNTLRVSGLMGDDTIDAPIRSGAIRHSISGVQVIAIPEPSSVGLLAISLFCSWAAGSARRRFAEIGACELSDNRFLTLPPGIPGGIFQGVEKSTCGSKGIPAYILLSFMVVGRI